MNERLLLQEGLAAQLYKISNPHGPLWHVLDERLRRRWRNKADDHLNLMIRVLDRMNTHMPNTA